jgi:chaperonin GroES
MAKIKPLGDKVLVKPNTSTEKTAGGIVLPDTAKERPQEGEVVAVGPGRVTENGEKVKVNVKVGDTVIYSKYGGTEIKVEGTEYLILDESSLLAVRKSDDDSSDDDN